MSRIEGKGLDRFNGNRSSKGETLNDDGGPVFTTLNRTDWNIWRRIRRQWFLLSIVNSCKTAFSIYWAMVRFVKITSRHFGVNCGGHLRWRCSLSCLLLTYFILRVEAGTSGNSFYRTDHVAITMKNNFTNTKHYTKSLNCLIFRLLKVVSHAEQQIYYYRSYIYPLEKPSLTAKRKSSKYLWAANLWVISALQK